MTLKEIREEFVKHSGRHDLVVDTQNYADDGADFFIQRGQRMLDDMLDTPKRRLIYELTTVEDQELYKVPNARSIDTVWITDSENDDELVFLEFMHFADFKEHYDQNTDSDLPKRYTFTDMRTDDETTADLNQTGILLGPVPDKAYTFFVRGNFYSWELTDDADQNWWTIEYPHTLIQAGLYMLERFYRNTSGMQDHMAAIQQDVRQIDFNVVEQEQNERSQMADSFNEKISKPRRYYGEFRDTVIKVSD